MNIFFTQQRIWVDWLQQHFFSVVPESTAVFFSRIFPWIVIGAVVGIFCILCLRALFRKQVIAFDTVFWGVFLSLVLAGITSELIKTIVAEPRPFLSGVRSLYTHGDYDSFPSGHTLLFTTLASAITVRYRLLGWFLGVCALVIGLARILVGIHWPLDILAGGILGVIIGKIGMKISRKIFHRK